MLLLGFPLPLTVGLMIVSVRKNRPALRRWAYGLTAVTVAGAIGAAAYYRSLPEEDLLFGYFVETAFCTAAAWTYIILLVIFFAVGFEQRVKEQTEINV